MKSTSNAVLNSPRSLRGGGRLVDESAHLERKLLELLGEVDGGDRNVVGDPQSHRREVEQPTNSGGDHRLGHGLCSGRGDGEDPHADPVSADRGG